ncbi:hypothetical protein J6590_063012 [Homalodisca vitripennis]|nr:hypothetical protein J6590_063012 [Homalodisca vitripennis]
MKEVDGRTCGTEEVDDNFGGVEEVSCSAKPGEEVDGSAGEAEEVSCSATSGADEVSAAPGAEEVDGSAGEAEEVSCSATSGADEVSATSGSDEVSAVPGAEEVDGSAVFKKPLIAVCITAARGNALLIMLANLIYSHASSRKAQQYHVVFQRQLN